jgi:hypothetical protein
MSPSARYQCGHAKGVAAGARCYYQSAVPEYEPPGLYKGFMTLCGKDCSHWDVQSVFFCWIDLARKHHFHRQGTWESWEFLRLLGDQHTSKFVRTTNRFIDVYLSYWTGGMFHWLGQSTGTHMCFASPGTWWWSLSYHPRNMALAWAFVVPTYCYAAGYVKFRWGSSHRKQRSGLSMFPTKARSQLKLRIEFSTW